MQGGRSSTQDEKGPDAKHSVIISQKLAYNERMGIKARIKEHLREAVARFTKNDPHKMIEEHKVIIAGGKIGAEGLPPKKQQSKT